MTNLNEVIIEGRLVRDASEGYKQSANGTAYGQFTIAVSSSEKKDGEWKDQVSYIDCKGFGKRYDYAVPRMTKGSTVRIVGSIRQERWTSQEGKNCSRILVEVKEFYPEFKKKDEVQQTQPQNDVGVQQGEMFPEDIPF